MKSFTISIILMLVVHVCLGQSRFLPFSLNKSKATEHPTLPNRLSNNYSNNDVPIEYSFPGAMISEKEIDGIVYQFLHIEGFVNTKKVGYPILPTRKEIVAVPSGHEWQIEMIDSTYIEYDNFMMCPAFTLTTDTKGAAGPQFYKNEQLYTTNAFYPNRLVNVSYEALRRGQKLIYPTLTPVQFNPATGKIRVYSNIKFKIIFKPTEISNQNQEQNSKNYNRLLKRSILNSDVVEYQSDVMAQSRTENYATNYIIITHSEFIEAAQKLAVWKEQLGYSVQIVSKNIWTSSSVRSTIEEIYSSTNPKPDYFVIIGDHDGQYAVPSNLREIIVSEETEAYVTDLFYACMDGDSDWHPDMAYGRISVLNKEEANRIIDKIITYEKTPPSNPEYYTDFLSCAYYQDEDGNGYADRRFLQTSEEIRDYMITEQGYQGNRVYSTDTRALLHILKYNKNVYGTGDYLSNELRNPLFNWKGDSKDIENEIEAGKFLVIHRDHGYVGGSGWGDPEYTTGSLNSLSNGNLTPVVFSMNCYTGAFIEDECFAEKFLRMENGGASGLIAASNYSISGYNDCLTIGMIDGLWPVPGLYPIMGSYGTGNNYTYNSSEGISCMGDLLVQGLYAMEQNNIEHEESGNMKYQYEIYHWFGDPAMQIWTANPYDNPVVASFQYQTNSLNVYNATPNATVTVVFNDKLICMATTDNDGMASLLLDAAISGQSILVTISKHNYLPLITNLIPEELSMANATRTIQTFLNDSGKSFLVYPNPSGGNFEINFYSSGEKQIKIISLTGKIMLQKSINGKIGLLDCSDFSKGVYLLSVITKDGNNIQKIVIQ